jgi:hypothetical protein
LKQSEQEKEKLRIANLQSQLDALKQQVNPHFLFNSLNATNGSSYLEVRNNVEQKTVRVASNGIGLTNILTKYEMMEQPAPSIQETDGQFIVIVPLIAKN